MRARAPRPYRAVRRSKIPVPFVPQIPIRVARPVDLLPLFSAVVADFIRAVHAHGAGFSSLSRLACERGGECYASIRNAAEYCVAERPPAMAGNCMLRNVTCDCLLDFLPVVESLSDYARAGDGIIGKTRDAEAPCM